MTHTRTQPAPAFRVPQRRFSWAKHFLRENGKAIRNAVEQTLSNEEIRNAIAKNTKRDPYRVVLEREKRFCQSVLSRAQDFLTAQNTSHTSPPPRHFLGLWRNTRHTDFCSLACAAISATPFARFGNLLPRTAPRNHQYSWSAKTHCSTARRSYKSSFDWCRSLDWSSSCFQCSWACKWRAAVPNFSAICTTPKTQCHFELGEGRSRWIQANRINRTRRSLDPAWSTQRYRATPHGR